MLGDGESIFLQNTHGPYFYEAMQIDTLLVN